MGVVQSRTGELKSSMIKTVLITGGARSGKSRLAMTFGEPFPQKAFLATALPSDEEMRERIEKHQRERDPSYVTFETPRELPQVLAEVMPQFDFVLVDSLALWLSNILMDTRRLSDGEQKIESLLRVLEARATFLVLVSDEVGMGLVPESKLGRDFQDLQGMLNQGVSRLADEVVFMVSGVPLWLKKEQVIYERL